MSVPTQTKKVQRGDQVSGTLAESAEIGSAVEDRNVSRNKPLDAAEFKYVLQQLDQMGFTWSSDIPPQISKVSDANGALASEKLHEIQAKYPTFPNELGYIVWYALTGTEPQWDGVGTEEELETKSAIVREHLITREFRDEFFLKHMLKVPYFANLEWEVVLKTSERGLRAIPGNAYALVSLLLQSNLHEEEATQQLTFAVNQQRLETLRKLLDEVHLALGQAHQIGDTLNKPQEDTADVS